MRLQQPIQTDLKNHAILCRGVQPKLSPLAAASLQFPPKQFSISNLSVSVQLVRSAGHTILHSSNKPIPLLNPSPPHTHFLIESTKIQNHPTYKAKTSCASSAL
ncbi:hypothetical protein E6O75_ATG03220 [Venturia nashicola]|uniref:Uncharacterized protein n=1 Tax=Venturia nashicola TaxID=86259 RepID=A0A4Z1PMX3_9PEZI|nr:hypothetical protein E6O75_ATG03220 [Venturia nashicola]